MIFITEGNLEVKQEKNKCNYVIVTYCNCLLNLLPSKAMPKMLNVKHCPNGLEGIFKDKSMFNAKRTYDQIRFIALLGRV